MSWISNLSTSSSSSISLPSTPSLFSTLSLQSSQLFDQYSTSQQKKLTQLMNWFECNNILAGDPQEIKEYHMKQKKSGIACLVLEQNKTNSVNFESQGLKKGSRKQLTVSTIF